ncbi:permease [Hungatella effluvii]|uniref:permease n=1 Tax=Hungatella effluvii TaxID=1096246 RepID=UPI002A80A980|nr:permease [Hungatella effluvii]
MYTIIIYIIVGGLFLLSYVKDKKKTKESLKFAKKSLADSLPQFIVLMMGVIYVLALVDAETISKLLGSSTGIGGILLSGVIGSVTLIPALIAFPLAANLLRMGAGYAQVTMLLTTLTMVGVVTMPMEIKYFGKKCLLRETLSASYTLF